MPPPSTSSNINSRSPADAITEHQATHTIMQQEIGNKTWQFDPQTVARMLSPKTLKMPKAPPIHPSVDDFNCLVDDANVLAAMNRMPVPPEPTQTPQKSQSSSHEPLAHFLQTCVHNCNIAYDDIAEKVDTVKPRSERWWPNLSFRSYGKNMGDSIYCTQPLKPDLAGVDDEIVKPGHFQCYWSLPPDNLDPNIIQLQIPVAVNTSWPELVLQAATYSRALFSAIPFRNFSLVIGINNTDHTLRFLIFHSGGVSASKDMRLDSPAGRGEIQRTLLSVVLWQGPEDAGIPSLTNGHDFRLPGLPDMHLDSVLSSAFSCLGTRSWVARLVPTNGISQDDTSKANTSPVVSSASPPSPRKPSSSKIPAPKKAKNEGQCLF